MPSNYTRYIDFLTYKAAQAGIPLSGTFELTARCNLDCKMCYIHKKANDSLVKKSEMSAAEWINIARTAKKAGMFLLLVTGGEPFLRPDFFEMYDEFKSLGLSVSINTNGTLITEKVVRHLAENSPARVNLTLYGASEETYSRLSGDETAFSRAYKAVEMLKEAKIPLKLNYSLTPMNKCDFDKICDFAEKNQLPLQPATYMFPPVRACELCQYNAVRVPADEAAEYAFRYDVRRFGENMAERCKSMLAGNVIDNDKECMELPTDAPSSEKIRCRAGLTAFWLTYSGEMRPCGMMQVPTVPMRELDFAEAWQKIRAEREKIFIPKACTECSMRSACESCPASCYAENGSFNTVPKYSCDKTAAYLRLAQNYIQKNESEK